MNQLLNAYKKKGAYKKFLSPTVLEIRLMPTIWKLEMFKGRRTEPTQLLLSKECDILKSVFYFRKTRLNKSRRL